MKLVVALILLAAIAGCGGKAEDVGGSEMTEPAQQVGDVMASIDEVGGSGGAIAYYQKESRRTFVRYAPEELEGNFFSKVFVKSAEAFTCDSNVIGHLNGGFSGCSSQQVTRTFGGCTIGSAQDVTFNGTVVFTWTTAGTCNMNNTNERVDRSPSFTVTGRRGATLTVSKDASYGQRLTLTSATGVTPKVYSLQSDGIRRKFTTAGGVTTFDYITTVASPVTITGEARNGRIMNGGTIRVKDNLTQVTCDYSPVNVTWGSGSCNCPTQGTWQATCSDSKTASLVLTGCGTGDFTLGGDSGRVTFDRCGN
jgi:hypothetical protein